MVTKSVVDLCLSSRIDEFQCVHMTEYYRVMKKNDGIWHVAAKINVTDAALNKQSKKTIVQELSCKTPLLKDSKTAGC